MSLSFVVGRERGAGSAFGQAGMALSSGARTSLTVMNVHDYSVARRKINRPPMSRGEDQGFVGRVRPRFAPRNARPDGDISPIPYAVF